MRACMSGQVGQIVPTLDSVQNQTTIEILMSASQPSDPAELFRQRGVQVTAQRLAVLRAVSGQPHATADEIEELVRARDRCRLSSGGLRRSGPSDRQGPHPAHPAGALPRPLRGPGRRQPPPSRLPHLRLHGRRRLRGRERGRASRPPHDHGFIIDEAEVIYWGVCPDCQQKRRHTCEEHNDQPAQ